MKKAHLYYYFSLIGILLNTKFASAQTNAFENEAIQEVIILEQKFSIMSQVYGLKKGFLSNMDTSALGLNEQGLYKMYPSWQKRKDNLSGLVWYPTDVMVGADKLWAISSGPSYRKTAKDSSYVKSGYYFTIWKRDKVNEDYKFVFDNGVEYAGEDNFTNEFQSVFLKQTQTKDKKIIAQNKQAIKQAIQTFQKTTSTQGILTALTKQLNNQFTCIIPGNQRVRTMAALNKISFLEQKTSFVDELTLFSADGNSALVYENGGINISNKASFLITVWANIDSKPKIVGAIIDVGQ